MKKSVFILSLLLVAITSKSLSYKDVYNVSTAKLYSTLKNGQMYYLIDEVDKTSLPIEDWKIYIKGYRDAPELVGANPKLLSQFEVYVNERKAPQTIFGVHHIAKAEFYSSLKDGQRYYLIDEVNETSLPIEKWWVYVKGERDADELVGANSKLLANFRVYVNRRVIEWRGRGNSIFSIDPVLSLLSPNPNDWHVDNCYPIFEKE